MVNTTDYKQAALEQTNWMAPSSVEANTGSWGFLGPNTVSSNDEGIGRVNRIIFHPTSATTLFASTAGGGLWKTTNSGSSWSCLTNGLPNLNTSGMAIDYSNPNILYLLTGDGDGANGGAANQFGYGRYSTGVLKSTDGGSTWYQTGLKFNETGKVEVFKIIIHPTKPNILFVASNFGIYKTSDGGSTWTKVFIYITYDIEFRPNNPTVIFASTDGTLHRSNNTGDSWTFNRTIPGSGRTAIAVCPSNNTKIYVLAGPSFAAGTFRGFFSFNTIDSTLTTVTTAPNILSGSSTGDDSKDQADYDLCLAVKPDNASYVYTGGIRLWRTTNGGSSFSWVDDYTISPLSKYHADIHDLAYNPLDGKLYMACDGGMYVSADNGATFSAINTNLSITQYYKISTSKTNVDLMLGGAQDNGTNKRTGNNSAFLKVHGADGMDCAFGNSSNAIHYVSEQDGVIYRSNNSGSSFSKIASPKIVDSVMGLDSGTTYAPWCTPIALHPANDNVIYLGYNRLIKVTFDPNNNTYSYATLVSYNAKTFVKVGKSNTNRIYIGDNHSSSGNNVIYRSDDGGTNWTNILYEYIGNLPPITDLTINPGNSLEIWLTYGGYVNSTKVLYSSDGGVTWINVGGSLPNIPINCIMYGDDANNTNDPVYIGTDIGIFYKDNTLADWIPFSNGLPSVEVTDLELNAADNLLRAGTYGRGIWQSSLYSSCVATLNLTTANQSVNTSYYHQVSNSITSTANAYGNGSNVFYKAGVEIILTDGFWAATLDSGSVFKAAIGPCSGGVPSRPASPAQQIQRTGYMVGPMRKPLAIQMQKP